MPGSRYAHAIAQLACASTRTHLPACLMELLPQNLGAPHLIYLLHRLCSPVQCRPALLGSASHDLCTETQGKQQCQNLKCTAAKLI